MFIKLYSQLLLDACVRTVEQLVLQKKLLDRVWIHVHHLCSKTGHYIYLTGMTLKDVSITDIHYLILII